LFALGVYFGSRLSAPTPDAGSPDGSSPTVPSVAEPPRYIPSEPEPHQPLPEASPTIGSEMEGTEVTIVPAPAQGARVALVIDDLGRSLGDVRGLEALGVPLSYAVLPFESKTREVVAALRRNDREILCHLPMQPVNGANPGPGALLRSMSPEELVAATRAALQAVAGATGVNNHMGSSFTTDRQAMRTVLGELDRHGLFFLDSRTSGKSVGYAQARALGLPAAKRQVFLDGDPNPEVIRRQFRQLLAAARQRGAAIGIGHPHPETLAILAEEVPRAGALGYEFVPVSYLLDSAGGPGD